MTVIPFPVRQLRARPAEIRAHIARSDGEPLPCTLLDLSCNGALINASEIVLPGEFMLLLNGQNLGPRRCRVISRTRDIVSVEFEAQA